MYREIEMKNKYSQWGEEIIVADFFGDFTGQFLDIGAFDGVTGSNTRLLAEKGWSGVLVEPNPANFVKLLDNCRSFPKLQCVNAAVARPLATGLCKFYDLKGQCGTLCEKDAPFYWVSAIDPLDLNLRLGNCDFLTVDAEGSDFEIFEAALSVFNPKLICFEDDIPGTHDPQYKARLLALLGDYGYTRIVGTTSTDERSANTLVAKA